MSDNPNNIPENGQGSRFDFLSDPMPENDGGDATEVVFDSDDDMKIADDNTTTRDFEPISQKADADGCTRTFDTVEDVKAKAKTENGRKGNKKAKEKPQTKTARAARATLKAVLFTLRKVSTYLLSALLTVLVVGLITGSVVVLAFVVYINNYVDPEYTGLDNLKFDSALSTTMYYVDENGAEVLLEDDTLESSENRLWAEYKDIPEDLINAYIAVEDQRFKEHNGVDMTRTASAIYNFFIPTSSNYGGGSTITQQLIKNVSGENEATIQRKVQEIFRAFNVEEKFSKEEILEMYLNTIYLSHNSYGVRVAAETYFGKELHELNLAECASIASIGKWPTHYDPISNPKNNLTRRNLVLKLMYEQGLITEEEFNQYYDAPITLADGSEENNSGKIHSYYIDAVMDDVMNDLVAKYGYDKATASRMLYSGGLQIVTCLDPVIQKCAETVYTDSSKWPETSGMQAQSAICIMDPDTGDILALVGGLGEKRENRGFNRATQSYRQCGSSIKPLSIYALAIDQGYINGGTALDDIPPVYNEDTEKYWPKNSSGKYQGLVSVDYAIKNSLNTVVVDLCNQMGVDTVYQNFKSYGYTTLADSVKLESGAVLSDIDVSPMALGGMTYGVTVREHTQAYSTLANGGMTSKARTYSVVRDSTGRVILDNSEKHDVKYRETTSVILTNLLTHVVTSGTAASSIDVGKKYNIDVAGKTGTTNDKKDVYFAGYTPDLVACCWYGFDNNKAITASGNPAARLWNSVFTEIYKYYSENSISYTSRFVLPSSVKEIKICSISGKRAVEGLCDHDAFKGSDCVTTAVFDNLDLPNSYCDVHVSVPTCATTGALCFDGHNNCIRGENIVLRKLDISDRSLIGNIVVQDAGYIYVDIPYGYTFPTDPKVPFFQNLLPEGITMGVAPSDTVIANRVCTDHIIGVVPDPTPTPEDPFGWDADDESD